MLDDCRFADLNRGVDANFSHADSRITLDGCDFASSFHGIYLAVPPRACPAAPDPEPPQLEGVPRLDLQAEAATLRTARGRWQLLLVVLACAAPVLASYFAYYVIRPEGRSNYATLIEPARELPAALSLRDLDGRAVDARTLRGQWLLVAVGSGAWE